MGVDCVSSGEIYTALNAGFPAEKIYFHGNNKTDADLAYALENGVGTIVVDNKEELESLSRLATERGVTQRILVRITPEIDPHTHRAVVTGNIDSKFGSPITTGAAMAMVKAAISAKGISFEGLILQATQEKSAVSTLALSV